jgi:hypothetical protein
MARDNFITHSLSHLNRYLSDIGQAPRPGVKTRQKVEDVRHGRWRHFKVRHFRGDAPRVRVRTSPLPLTSVKAVEIWKLNSVTGVWQRMSAPLTPISTPYVSCEKTQDKLNPGPPFTTGGPFTSVKINLLPFQVNGIGIYTSAIPINIGFGSGIHQYRGGFTDPQFIGVDFSDSQYRDRKFIFGDLTGFIPSLVPYHTVVDDRLRPRLNRASIGQSLAELREIPSMLRNTARDLRDYWSFIGGSPNSNRLSPKGLADSFLNGQFGWTPFVRDIYDVCNVIVNYDLFISDLSRRNGKWEHREGVIKDETTETVISSGLGYKVSPAGFLVDQFCTPGASWTARYSYIKRETSKVWASGDYTFYRPSFDMSQADYDSGMNQIRRLMTLLGTDISPSLLWKITPWTWLIDWFTNVGKMIEAADAAAMDGVLSKNVYLMMRWKRELVLQQEINMASRPLAFEFTRVVESKQRGHAETPFNFGLLPSALSSKQLTILGALGISHLL